MKFNKNVKFVVAIIALLAIVAGIVFQMVKPYADGYKDVSDKDWFYPAVQYMADKGYMTGYSSTEFGPNDTLSRAMFVTILYRVSGEKVQTTTTKFVDVPTNTWYTEAVAWAVANGITSGTSNNTFSPTAPVTREQMATLMQRYATSKGIDLGNKYVTGLPNDLCSSNSWGREGMVYAYEYGLLFATNGKTNPTYNATRTDAVVAFYNFLHKNAWVTPDGMVCNHEWATRHIDEVGHYESSGTHKVVFKKCNCGFELSWEAGDSNAYEVWKRHNIDCGQRYLNWTEEVPNGDSKYVVDIQAYDEVYCSICGTIQ